ncbi:MAG: cellulase family glycosylhydrolase [Kineosporiaceae bacterium]
MKRSRRTLVPAVVLALGAATVLSSAAGAAEAAPAVPSCSASYAVTNSWPGGYTAAVTLTNSGQAWRDARLTFTPGSAPMQGWTGSWTATDAGLSVATGAVASGASVVLGYTALGAPAEAAPAFAVDGVGCSAALAPAAVKVTKKCKTAKNGRKVCRTVTRTIKKSPRPTTSAPVPTTTTPLPTTSSPTPTPTGSTPVERWGQLRVCGTTMCDRNGSKVQLRGVSSMWLNWEDDGYAENLQALKTMRDQWGLTVIRAAMGVEPAGAYLSNPSKATAQVDRIVQNAIDAGVYVIVDWHDHNAANHTSQSVQFFTDMARKYGNQPNVIWETFNEPLQVSWTGVLKPYHQSVVSAIRSVDPDNIVVLGTPQWSQKVDEAALSPVSGTNLMYTLHFYSCTHTQWLRDAGDKALQAGLPLFVTEWGATNADGGLDGKVCESEGQAWIDWMKARGVSWAAWKLDGCTDSSCILREGAPASGPWDSWLQGHGAFVKRSVQG